MSKNTIIGLVVAILTAAGAFLATQTEDEPAPECPECQECVECPVCPETVEAPEEITGD